ncbi:MAG TPA: DUF1553 domain-containing protein, partial [Humisphaera sp.]
RCYECHGPQKQKADLRLDAKAAALKGGEGGPAIVPGKSADSPLAKRIASHDPDAVMPPKGDRLTPEQVALIRAWIDQGAKWPDEASAKVDPRYHWSFKPIAKPPVPPLAGDDAKWARTPVDAFVLAKLREKGLSPSPEADRRTLIRRVTYDLTGLPPSPEEVDAFVADPAPGAYDRLVDRLLASPRYGERWARHWLDAVHYGDTHGYDKDKVRPNAWPYRDYVIRSLNADKPYDRFVREQLAGDRLYPGDPDGVIALGFLAAGPWDFVGQAELREGTLDKAVTRNLDRDDMVATTMNTFVSLTAQCARCHNHKFDPVSQEDYYSLQAVFAAVDRADRPYDADPAVATRRQKLEARRVDLLAVQRQAEAAAKEKAGPMLAAIDAKLAAARKPAAASSGERPEFGYHSRIEPAPDKAKWVQVDLGARVAVDRVVLVGAHDPFGGIGAGFGFPVRYKVELSDDPAFAAGVAVVADHTAADVPNPACRPQTAAAGGKAGRYVRVTATKLAARTNDYIFALGELMVLAADGTNLAAGKAVAALDSIEAPPRWRRANLVDGYYYGIGKAAPAMPATDPVAALKAQRQAAVAGALDEPARQRLAAAEAELATVDAGLAALPKPGGVVYAAATHFAPSGSFTPTLGKPRPVHLLHRGSEKDPRQEVSPGTVHAVAELPSRFDLPAGHDESDRRAALAEWIVDRRNPLTWRSIVNRVWQHHFGKGILETPNDLGHMGAPPTHPELLDYLAAEFRDGGTSVPTPRSLKALHRLIVTSAAYRQSSADDPAKAKLDGGNQFLWRMNRARLDAEGVRDSVLAAAGKLDLTMGGPGFQAFGFKDDHSPHYKYAEADPDDPKTHRRSVYRFVVRSVPDPFMEALDCADPSQVVPKRNETLTALQALAMLNNPFTLRMAGHFAARVEPMGRTPEDRAAAAFRLALGRAPTAEERQVLGQVAKDQGLPAACRVIFNLNEFAFVD